MKWIALLLSVIWLGSLSVSPDVLVLGMTAFQPWQPATYWLVHVGILHLIANVSGLLWVAPQLERRYGELQIVKLFLLCVTMTGALFYLLTDMPLAGASAGLFGLITLWVVTFPFKKLFGVTVGMWGACFMLSACLWTIFDLKHLPHLLGATVMLVWVYVKGGRSLQLRLK